MPPSKKPESQLKTRLGIAACTALGLLGLDYSYGLVSAHHYSPRSAEALLEHDGYSGVKLVKTDLLFVEFRGCDVSPGVEYFFRATTPNGIQKTVEVCDEPGFAAAIQNSNAATHSKP